MRIFDFIIQTLLLFAALFSLTIGKEAVVFVAIFQFFMGCWQLLSAIITTANMKHGVASRTKMIRIYWICVGVYVFGWAPVYFLRIDVIGYAWFFSAWLIAVFYYVLTIKLAFDVKKDRETFLDIAN